MATSPNSTQITPPRVPLIDERTGAVSREWYRWFYSLYDIVGTGTGIIPVTSGGTGLSNIPTNGQLLIGNGTGYTLNTLTASSGITVTNAAGTITVANSGVLSFSGGSTGLTPATASTGAVTLAGTLAIANGGTNGSAAPTAYGVAYGDGSAYVFTAAGTTGQVLTATTGSAPTWAAPATSGTVTSVSFTGGLITVATATTTPALTVAGTSGGVVYFSSASTWASSAVLASNALVVGGGASVAPSTVTTGTGVVTALGVNTGTAGAFVVNGGALGTPSSGTVTNLTGTASININGTVGATTPDSGAFTSLSSTGNTTLGDAGTDTVTVNGYMGVGGAATADRSINILGTSTTTNAVQEGIRSAFTANSTATTAIRSFISVPATQAAAFTVTDVAGFWAANATLGASSTITNAHGLYIANQTRGTNNYGITSLVASGANKYNFYASGTAANWFSGDVLVFGAGGLGYTTGSGGTTTQVTSRTTGVTLNKTNGAITLVSAAGLATFQSFTVTNSTVAATDVVHVTQKSGTDLYQIFVTATAAGSFRITFATTGGITVEQPVFNFAVIKGVTA
jgi:hypothetical protein